MKPCLQWGGSSRPESSGFTYPPLFREATSEERNVKRGQRAKLKRPYCLSTSVTEMGRLFVDEKKRRSRARDGQGRVSGERERERGH